MGKINILSEQVAALIAAGEVVERPSSVIKELVENSIDANARSITVEIKNGGITYMRVTDDGAGIEKDDVPAAFVRHATSKISEADDLESIVTLGFRGEALHSIAAVSTVELLTARHGAPEGTYARVAGGEVEEISPAGCPQGTTITVRELFYNTPARMKFLKKDASEAGLVEDVVRRIALARPDISVRYINSGKEIFFTPGDNKLKNAVYAIYGRDIAQAMIEADYEENGVRVSGLIGKAELSRGNRSYQTFFVNGRCVINKNLYFSLAEGYKSHMMTGRFPVAVLNISINPALCDVNVHPSKAEIKFADDKAVAGAVYWATRNALHSVEEQREMTLPNIEVMKTKVERPAPLPEQKRFSEIINASPSVTVQKPYEPKFEQKTVHVSEPAIEEKTILHTPHEIIDAQTEHKQDEEIKILGQLFETYIVAQCGDSMLMVDQHAAHERLIYEELVNGEGEPNSQMLLMPEMLQLSGTEFALFRENTEFFEKSGFEIEEFGQNTIRISMIPASLSLGDAATTVSELLEILGNGREKIASLHDRALYSLACKAALKAGQTLSEPEQRALIKKALALSGEVTCPHGRPVILRLTKQQIEKQFRRIV